MGLPDVSNRVKNEISSMDGRVMTEVTAVIGWTSKKITRVVSSIMMIETLSPQQVVADYLSKRMNVTGQMLLRTRRMQWRVFSHFQRLETFLFVR